MGFYALDQSKLNLEIKKRIHEMEQKRVKKEEDLFFKKENMRSSCHCNSLILTPSEKEQ